MKFAKITFLLLFLLLMLGVPVTAHAGLLPGCASQAGGCATLESLIQFGVAYGKLILGVSGSVALVFFVYGGFLMLVSHGNSEYVKKGTKVLIAATIGLIIIFGSFTAVKFLLRFVDPTGTYDTYIATSTRR